MLLIFLTTLSALLSLSMKLARMSMKLSLSSPCPDRAWKSLQCTPPPLQEYYNHGTEQDPNIHLSSDSSHKIHVTLSAKIKKIKKTSKQRAENLRNLIDSKVKTNSNNESDLVIRAFEENPSWIPVRFGNQTNHLPPATRAALK